MAVSIAKLDPNPDMVVGNKKFKFRKVTGDNSYPDGGEEITAANVGLTVLEAVIPLGSLAKTDEEGAYAVSFDYTSDTAVKLVVYQGDNDNGADAPFIEADSADLSSYELHAIFIGW